MTAGLIEDARVVRLAMPQGRAWTWADLQEMHDDGHRCEIVDGSLHVSASPSRPHQVASGRLVRLLADAAPDGVEVVETVDVELPGNVFETGRRGVPGGCYRARGRDGDGGRAVRRATAAGGACRTEAEGLTLARQPEGPPPPPTVQRVRVRYAKRGRLRFTSHRDFARAFERSLRRAVVPVAFSAGFSPHPKVSYVGAAPTGVASEAEYLELGLSVRVDVERLRLALDAALPPGLDVLECVEATPGGGSLPDRIDASAWRVELPGADPAEVEAAVEVFLARDRVEVDRLTKDGRRSLDARGPVVSILCSASPGGPGESCAILDVVVRQASPAVRPDDVLAALSAVAGFAPTAPARATRLAQGRLDDHGRLADPLASDRAASPAIEAAGAPRPDEQPAPSVGTTSAS